MSFEFTSTAMAQQTASTAVPAPTLIENILPFLLIFIAMYFIMIRPQAKKAKEHSELLKGLKNGDEVVTSGGIIGRVKSVSEGFVTLDLGNAHVKVLKEHILSLTKKEAAKVQPAKTIEVS